MDLCYETIPNSQIYLTKYPTNNIFQQIDNINYNQFDISFNLTLT